MSEIAAQLANALSIIESAKATLQACINGDSERPTGGNPGFEPGLDPGSEPGVDPTGEPGFDPGPIEAEPVPAPIDVIDVDEIPLPTVFPNETWGLSAEGSAKIYRLLRLQGEANFELIRLSDGTFQLSMYGGAGGGVQIPLTGLGGDFVQGNGVTLDLSQEELQWLADQGVPIPEDALWPGTDTSGVSLNPIDNVSSVRFDNELTVNLDGLGIPLPSTDVIDRLTDFDFPDHIDLEGEASHGFEVRKDANGNWEIVASTTVTGEFEITTDHETPGGTLGSILDTFTIGDADNISVTGNNAQITTELVYNTETNQFYQREVVVTTSFEGEGTSAGLDVPILDEVLGTPSHDAVTGVEGTTSTTTTTTITDLNGNVINQTVQTSEGTFDHGESDLIVSDAEIETEYSGHGFPEDTTD